MSQSTREILRAKIRNSSFPPRKPGPRSYEPLEISPSYLLSTTLLDPLFDHFEEVELSFSNGHSTRLSGQQSYRALKPAGQEYVSAYADEGEETVELSAGMPMR